MAHDYDRVCLCVSEHRPPYLELEEHHILPIYLGGAKDGETIWLCGTTHTSVHEILRMMLRSYGEVGYGRLTYGEVQARQDRPVARYAYNLARRGYDLWLTSQ